MGSSEKCGNVNFILKAAMWSVSKVRRLVKIWAKSAKIWGFQTFFHPFQCFLTTVPYNHLDPYLDISTHALGNCTLEETKSSIFPSKYQSNDLYANAAKRYWYALHSCLWITVALSLILMFVTYLNYFNGYRNAHCLIKKVLSLFFAITFCVTSLSMTVLFYTVNIYIVQKLTKIMG